MPAPDPSARLELQTVTLQRLKLGLMTHLGPDMLQSLELEVAADYLSQMMAARLTAMVLAERVQVADYTSALEVPATWWDHLKADRPRAARWWSRWVWRLAPPRRRRAEIHGRWEDHATFPHATYVNPDPRRLGPVIFQRTGQISASWDADGLPPGHPSDDA